MAGETDIFRPATDAEKHDFVEIGSTDILQVFLAKLAETEAKFRKKYIPFDSFTARMEFEDKIQKYMNDLSTTPDKAKRAERRIVIGDLDKYGDIDRFELVKIQTVDEDKLIDGMRQPTTIGKRYFFKGKSRGNRYSLFVPIKDLKLVEDKYKMKEEEEEVKK